MSGWDEINCTKWTLCINLNTHAYFAVYLWELNGRDEYTVCGYLIKEGLMF